MFVKDLTAHPFTKETELLAVGWLDTNSTFVRGEVSTEFINKLWSFIKNPRISTLGRHYCDFCGDYSRATIAEYQDEKRMLGSSHTYVLGNKSVYLIPDLIFHYVQNHDYIPPQEFINALLSSPEPDSEEYQKRLEELNL